MDIHWFGFSESDYGMWFSDNKFVVTSKMKQECNLHF